MAVGSQDRAAEALDQPLERRLARLDHVARDLVGVDDRHAQSAEEFRGGGFAAGDAAGQADAEDSALMRLRSRVARNRPR